MRGVIKGIGKQIFKFFESKYFALQGSIFNTKKA